MVRLHADRLAGAYVLHLGARTPWSLRGPRVVVAEEARTAVRPWRQGFVADALDPEAPIMFLSLLARFVPAGGSGQARTLLFALVIVAPALVWFPAVALFVDRLGCGCAARDVATVNGTAPTGLSL